MGMVGTVPAAGRVLLVGDAAGLVNPLQGEGIAQAMTSGRAAAEAVLGSPGQAAGDYRRPAGPSPSALPADHRRRPRRPGRPAPGRGRRGPTAHRPRSGRALAGGWGIFWNELLDGAVPGGARRVAGAIDGARPGGHAGSGVSRWFTATFDGGGADGGGGNRAGSVARRPVYPTVTEGP